VANESLIIRRVVFMFIKNKNKNKCNTKYGQTNYKVNSKHYFVAAKVMC